MPSFNNFRRELFVDNERRTSQPGRIVQNHTTLVVVDESCYYRTCSISTHSPEPVHISRLGKIERDFQGEKKRLAPTANTMDCDEINRLNETVLDLQCRSMKTELFISSILCIPVLICWILLSIDETRSRNIWSRIELLILVSWPSSSSFLLSVIILVVSDSVVKQHVKIQTKPWTQLTRLSL
jgi:hypothetical protein